MLSLKTPKDLNDRLVKEYEDYPGISEIAYVSASFENVREEALLCPKQD